MFVYELMIRREDEGKETAEEEKQIFYPFTVFLGLFVVILCAYMSVREICFCIWISFHGFGFFFSFLSIKSQLYTCVVERD